ncbi:MAG: hypothetical protein ACKO0W_05095, partial [Planctomycetota bacterium]
LGRVDGAREKSMGDSAVFSGAMEVAGGKGDVYAVLATANVKPLLGAFPTFMIVEPLVQRFFGDIKAWSAALHLKDGVIESNIGIYVPDGKVGLLSLVDAPSAPSAPPSIVPSDALSYGRLNMRFDKVVATLDDVIASLPPDQAEMIKPQLDMYRPAMTAAFAALGPEVHLWSTQGGDDPLNQGGTVTAIAMKNDKESAAAVSDFMNLIPLGLQSRDFNGMTILSDEFAPFAIGVGGGYLVIGDTQRVEQALRAVDAKGDAGLAGDADFDRSFSRMAKEPIAGFSWTDTARQIGSTAGMMQLAAGQMAAVGGLEEGAEAIPGIDFEPGDLFSILGKMTPEVAKRCFGDAILEFRSTPKGFVTKWSQMPASGG